jgi:UDP-N-acetylglucosamine 2-epimerase (non-hydrolysing)
VIRGQNHFLLFLNINRFAGEPMKIMTVLGTRPEIIRLSLIIPKLDKLCDHVLVHTGQNYDPNLKDIFFEQLGVRAPDHYLDARGSFSEQLAIMLPRIERLMVECKPDRLLILGDTNSGLAAIIAKRMGIPVYHMEAGNRCYDDRVPEETNRRIIDHSSDILMPYTERSRQNLLREGIQGERIYVTGNPIKEVIDHHVDRIALSPVLRTLDLERRKYFLVTVHRAENVDVVSRLKALTEALVRLQNEYKVPVIVSTHPRTRSRMEACRIDIRNDEIRFLDPFGFFDFIALEQHALCVLSDSGTVQEECCILKVPNVTLRDVTERPETIECGSNVLSGADVERISTCVGMVVRRSPMWAIPSEYTSDAVSDTVVNMVLQFNARRVCL